MANTNSQEPPLWGRYIETPMKKYYGVPGSIIYPHIFFTIAILTIIGFLTLI